MSGSDIKATEWSTDNKTTSTIQKLNSVTCVRTLLLLCLRRSQNSTEAVDALKHGQTTSLEFYAEPQEEDSDDGGFVDMENKSLLVLRHGLQVSCFTHYNCDWMRNYRISLDNERTWQWHIQRINSHILKALKKAIKTCHDKKLKPRTNKHRIHHFRSIWAGSIRKVAGRSSWLIFSWF